ncbi:MAG: hypothetical protein WCH01_10020 [Methylococcaceae bacterium]
MPWLNILRAVTPEQKLELVLGYFTPVAGAVTQEIIDILPF